MTAEFSDLPYELVDKIYDFLPLKDAYKLSLADKYNQGVWKNRKDAKLFKKYHDLGYETDKLTLREYKNLYLYDHKLYGKFTNDDIDRWLDTLIRRIESALNHLNYQYEHEKVYLKRIEPRREYQRRSGKRSSSYNTEILEKVKLLSRVISNYEKEIENINRLVEKTSSMPPRRRFKAIIEGIGKLSLDTAGY